MIPWKRFSEGVSVNNNMTGKGGKIKTYIYLLSVSCNFLILFIFLWKTTFVDLACFPHSCLLQVTLHNKSCNTIIDKIFAMNPNLNFTWITFISTSLFSVHYSALHITEHLLVF